MSEPWLLSKAQMCPNKPCSPLSHGAAGQASRSLAGSPSSSGMVCARVAPSRLTVRPTIYNRFIRWSRLGVFNKIFASLAAKGGKPDRLMINTPPLDAPHRLQSDQKTGFVPRRIGRIKDCPDSKIHAVGDCKGRS